MTRAVWNLPGNRFYQTGVDRGMLYVEDEAAGVPWSGLILVEESAMEGESQAYYQNAVKFYESNSPDDFKATISAFNYPPEFQRCDGTAMLNIGLYADRQNRSRFGMSYRTLVGNDVDGTDHSYKIHIIYNALATPAAKNFSSLSGQVAPTTFNWGISTIPIEVPGQLPAAHFVIDTREVDRFLLPEFEDILYGSPTTDPRLPTIDEILALFNSWSTLIITDLGNGLFEAEGPDEVVYMTSDTEFVIDWPSAVYLDETTYTVQTL